MFTVDLPATRLAFGALVLSLAASATVEAATQCVNSGAPAPLEICVQDSATPGVWIDQPNGRTYQYYGQYAWGSSVLLDGTNTAMQFDTGYFGTNPVTPVSNVTTGTGTAADPYIITTVVDLGTTGVRFTQRFTYVNGDRNFRKAWRLENTGSSTFNDVRFFHGGDTYFGGSDSARSWYDADLRMVYVNNNSFSNSGYMGFYANPLTPFDHYFSGGYYTGYQLVTAGQLDDTSNSSFLDAGYYLQWNRASLEPGQAWNVEAFETWSPPGSLQVLTPASEYVTPGSTVRKSFKVHNLSDTTPLNVTLSASTASGWTATLPGASSLSLAPLEVVEVPVEVEVPSSAAAGTNEVVQLNVTDGALNTVVGETRLLIPSVDYTFSSQDLNFGSVAPGGYVDLVLTLTAGSGSLSVGQVATAAPFSIVGDTCSNATIAASATCTITVRFAPTAEAEYTDALSVPVTGDTLIGHSIGLFGVSADAVAVTASAGVGGTIAPTSVAVPSGETTTFTITPEAGYAIGSVSGCSGTLTGNTYTTAAISAACSVSVTFEQTPAEEPTPDEEEISDVVVTGKGNGGGGAFDWALLGGMLLMSLTRLRRGAAVAALGAVATTGAQAADADASSHWYVGGSLADANSSEDAGDLTRALRAQGYDVTASIDDERSAWRIFAGWSLSPYVSFEAGYTDLGEVTTSYDADIPVSSVDPFLEDAVALHPRSADGFDVSVVGRYPLGSRFAVRAQVGAFMWDAERRIHTSDDRTARETDSGTDLLWSAGADCNVYRNLDLVAAWTRFGLDNEHVETLSLGAQYRW